MADLVCNVAKGRVNELVRRVNNNDPANSALVIVAINAGAATDDQLRDADTLAALLATAAAEVTNTGYSRQTLTDTDLADPTIDDSGNTQDADFPDIDFGAITAGDSWTDLVVCYDNDTTGGTDANLIPLTVHDFAITPDGSNVTAQVDAAGFYSAS